jgi:hypothetical protein
VGLIGSGPSRPPVKVYFLNLRAREVWNKIYIDLSEPIAGLAMDGYQIVLRAIHDPERPLSEIWLDNVKLMHFQ